MQPGPSTDAQSAESEESAGAGQFIKAMSLTDATMLVAGSMIGVVLLIADKTRAQALSGLVLVAVGIPVYFLWRSVDKA